MASIQSEDQDDTSFNSIFNTAQSSVSNSESSFASNVHEHCRPRKSDEPERKGKYLCYYCKYCTTGHSTSTSGL